MFGFGSTHCIFCGYRDLMYKTTLELELVNISWERKAFIYREDLKAVEMVGLAIHYDQITFLTHHVHKHVCTPYTVHLHVYYSDHD